MNETFYPISHLHLVTYRQRLTEHQPFRTGDPFAQPAAGPPLDHTMLDSSLNALDVHELGDRRLSQRTGDVTSHADVVATDETGAYVEEAFRYLLAIERKRAERSGRPFFLLLVDLKRAASGSVSMDADVASLVLNGLAAVLRDTDFTGWYREGRIVGAVLAQLSDSGNPEITQAVGQRVRDELLARLPSKIAERIQTRLFQVPRSSRG